MAQNYNQLLILPARLLSPHLFYSVFSSNLAVNSSLYKEIQAVKCSITNAVRLGKKLQGSKPRLLKFTLASMQEKKSILRSKIH